MLNGKTPHTDLAMWISRIQSKLMAVRLCRLQWLFIHGSPEVTPLDVLAWAKMTSLWKDKGRRGLFLVHMLK